MRSAPISAIAALVKVPVMPRGVELDMVKALREQADSEGTCDAARR